MRGAGSAPGGTGLGTRSIYYRRATISCSQGVSALPFDDASVVHPPSVFGTFRVLHQIGSGVLGPVFRALDSDRDCLVAIKAFKLDLLPEQTERFVAALRDVAARPALHPGIVAAGDAGLEGTTPYLALDYAPGDGLDVAVRAVGAFTPAETLEICRSLAAAIDAGWKEGVGHGALHPRDIFVDGTEVAITGFGVAQALETVGLNAPVRRPYSSPERVEGRPWGQAADVFSLAAIAQELLAVPGVLNRFPALPAVLGRALADHADHRFATAGDMVEALAAALSDEHEVKDTIISIAPPPPDVAPRLDRLDDDPIGSTPIHPDDRIELEAPVPAVLATPPNLKAHHQPFPWAATVAVLVAGAALGAVAGYRVGWSHGEDAAIARSVLETPSGTLSQAEPTPAPLSQAPATSPAPATPPPVSQPDPVATSAPTVQTPASVAAASSRSTQGSVFVDSRPRGASVTLNGRRVGLTPLPVQGLLPGDHRVQIELAGHRQVASTVKVLAGRQTRFAVRLEEARGGGR